MGKPDGLLWMSEPRTVLKHRFYQRYLACWMGKICQRFPVASIVDAFAGPGEYKDGLDGSPLVIAKTYLEHNHHDRFNALSLVCLDESAERAAHLTACLQQLFRPAKFRPVVMPAGRAWQSFAALNRAAHDGDANRPTLWILDPFDHSSVPFEFVWACLQQPRDEVLVTWFADELYRFLTDRAKHGAFDRHFGHDGWRRTLDVTGEQNRKEALLAAYREGIEGIDGVRTGAFSITSKNAHARYSFVFATHHARGLECFNSATWKMDPLQGASASERVHPGQDGLFAEAQVDPLRARLEKHAGISRTFQELVDEAAGLGYKESHLRAALSEMATVGLAVREHPSVGDYSRSPWPKDSVVRFYPAPADDETR